MKHQDIYNQLNQIAPYQIAEEWDPTGPVLGNLYDQTKSVLLSLDLTDKSYQLAVENDCNLIITHHPFLFTPINRILAENPEQHLLLKLIKQGMTVISCHTNLDAAENGVAVSFLEQSLRGLSYHSDLEILVKNEHYSQVGHGRIVSLTQPVLLSRIQKQIDFNLKTSSQINTDSDRKIKKICFTPGAFDESWIPLLAEKQIELLITGEIKHHVGVMLNERGIAMLAAGHGASEQTVIPHLKSILEEIFPAINFVENPGIIYNLLKSE